MESKQVMFVSLAVHYFLFSVAEGEGGVSGVLNRGD